MENQIATALRAVLHEIADHAAHHAAEEIVRKETEGMTLEERVHRIEIQSQINDASFEALAEKYRNLKQNLNSMTDAFMSVIFELAGHVLERPFTEEDQKAISDRANELRGDDKDANHAGWYIRDAVRELILKG